MSLLTPQQVADRLGCGRQHVYTLIHAKVLEGKDISLPGAVRRTWRVSAAVVSAFLEEREEKRRAERRRRLVGRPQRHFTHL
jgi:excisionase family DNA binding protein